MLPMKHEVIKVDMNENEKALDINLEPLDESNIGDLSEIQKAAPLPVATQPLYDSSLNQTQSHSKKVSICSLG